MTINKLLTEYDNHTLWEIASTELTSVQKLRTSVKYNKMHPDLQQMVDEGNCRLYNAYMLAKLPIEKQLALLPYIGERANIFVPRIKKELKRDRAGTTVRTKEVDTKSVLPG